MLATKAYFDLCISEEAVSPENCEKTIKTLYDLGYRTIAINQCIEDGPLRKKNKKGELREVADVVPVPFDLRKIEQIKTKLDIKDLTVLNRLTVEFSFQEVLHKITKDPQYKKYNLIAVQPMTLSAFSFCCNNLEADIISYNPENKLGFKVNRKWYNQLVDRGYHFELLYKPAIEDSTKRQNLICASHLYHAVGKSKNIIFSSGATSSFFIRSPYDIINLGFLFGLSELQCKNAISNCCRQVIINAVGRRHGKAVMFVEKEQAMDILSISSDEEDEDMERSQPAFKKSKQ